MSLWKSNLSSFSEAQRNHSGKRLIRNFVLNNEVEISCFRNDIKGEFDEIYIDFGIFTGVIYVEKHRTIGTFLRITVEIEREYNSNHGVPSDQFIFRMIKKYNVIRTDESLFNPYLFDLFYYKWYSN